MRLVLIVPPTGKVAQKQRVVLGDGDSIDLGGAADCRAVVDDPSVGTARVRLARRGSEWTVQDLDGFERCVVGGVRLRARARRILGPLVSLRLGDVECTMEVDVPLDEATPTYEIALRLAEEIEAIAADAPRVRIAEGSGMGEAIALARGKPYLVGRGNGVDLFLDDADVSRCHASVEWSGDRVLVTDLGSSGGTYLGTARLESNRSAVWSPGRMIVAGKTVLLLEATAAEVLAEVGRKGELADVTTTLAMPRRPTREGAPPTEDDAVKPAAAEDEAARALPVAGRGDVERQRRRLSEVDVHERRVRIAVAGFIVFAIVVLTWLVWVLVSAH